jgi:hypothetical protein
MSIRRLEKSNLTVRAVAIVLCVQYRATGVMTFLVRNEGIVDQKDLGPDSAKIASAMTRYDPDEGWLATEDEESDTDDGD